MPRKIIIIRHGETDYNKEHRMQGQLDVPLNDIGREQARISAAKLRGVRVDAIYSSDLSRAHETAQHISQIVGIDIVTTPALRERDMGIFSGWSWKTEHDDVKDKLWVEFELARNIDLDWNKHQGESMHQLAERVSTFMQHLHDIHQDQTVIIVTHGGTINTILEHYGVKSVSDGFRPITNASLLVLHKEPTSYRLTEI